MSVTSVTSLAAASAIVAAVLLQACATSDSDDRQNRVTDRPCPPGHILACDTRSAGRISDGRYGRNNAGFGRRRHCGCQPEQDLDSLEAPPLPPEPR